MKPRWFESITGGLTLDEYIESVFLVSVVTQQHNGGFSLSGSTDLHSRGSRM